MSEPLKLMCVLAHPDDESLGTGGILAKYGAEGVETYVISATRGERGWNGDPEAFPGLEALGKMREEELRAAAAVLGVRQVDFLDYIDGDLDKADPAEATAKIVGYLRRVRPQVVISFGPDGAYGHPDHIAISQFTMAAVVAAADQSYATAHQLPPHRVSKLYYMAETQEISEIYRSLFGELNFLVDGVNRGPIVWDDWAITTRINAEAHWQTVWRAIACHRTQLPSYDKMAQVGEEVHRKLWGHQTYYRVLSLVNGGRVPEHDLFEGLR